MTAAKSAASSSCHSVDLINKNNTRSIFLRILKKITHARCADTYEHFHKIRTRNTEKRHSRLSCNSFCKKCFSCSRRSFQQNAFRNTSAYLHIFFRRFQKIDDLRKFFFLFLQSRYICKRHLYLVMICHAGAAFSEVHRFCIRPVSLTVHKKEKQHDPAKRDHGRRRTEESIDVSGIADT